MPTDGGRGTSASGRGRSSGGSIVPSCSTSTDCVTAYVGSPSRSRSSSSSSPMASAARALSSAVVSGPTRSSIVTSTRLQPGQHAPDQLVAAGPERVQLQRLERRPPLDRGLVGCRATDGDEQPVEVAPGARVVARWRRRCADPRARRRPGARGPAGRRAANARSCRARRDPRRSRTRRTRCGAGRRRGRRTVVGRHRGDPHDRGVDAPSRATATPRARRRRPRSAAPGRTRRRRTGRGRVARP